MIRADHAERAAIGLDLAVARILDHAHRQIERAEIAEEADHAHDLAGGIRQRLALLAVRMRASSLVLASIASAILMTSLRRSAIGVAAHAG